MAVPESEFPGKGKPAREAFDDVRFGPAGPRNTSRGGALSRPGNRPIPLKARQGADLPDADDDDFEDPEDSDLREILRNAPAWLVSTVFHMLLLIILGLLVYSRRDNTAAVQIDVSVADPGDQLDDPSVLDATATKIETLTEQLIAPTDLDPVDDPLAAPLEMVELNLPVQPTIPAAISPIEDATIGLALKGREKGTREALLKKYGGTAGTEDAVEAGLQWLVRQQRNDGSWSLSGPYDFGSHNENEVAATAMALLAFQGHGDTHRDGKYAKYVDRGWRALLKLQNREGLFSGALTQKTQSLYAHAQATIALCELYGMTKDSRFRGPAERAVAYCVDAQDKKGGGWRYFPRVETDTSVTGWFVMALQSARMAGIVYPPEVLQRVNEYLNTAALDDGRRYGYQGPLQPTDALAAEGLLCRQYLGWPQDDPRLIDGITDLVENVPIRYDRGRGHDVYYWYYATQVAHHMEGKIWSDWNSVMRVVVPAEQVKQGAEAGSWGPQGDRWGEFSGRLYMTCLSIYMLEVYYRHLPIYTGYQFIAGVGKTMDPSAKPGEAEAPQTDAGQAPDEVPQVE